MSATRTFHVFRRDALPVRTVLSAAFALVAMSTGLACATSRPGTGVPRPSATPVALLPSPATSCAPGGADIAQPRELADDTLYLVTNRQLRAATSGPSEEGRSLFAATRGGVSNYRVLVRYSETLRPNYYAAMDAPLCWSLAFEPVEAATLRAAVGARIDVAGPWHHGALVYVHGFNNSAEDAVSRAAEVKRRLRYDGALVVFSWPASSEGVFGFPGDENRAASSVDDFREFLEDLAGSVRDPSRLHVAAHSMGSRIVLAALDPRGSRRPPGWRQMGTVSFLAPDVDTLSFAVVADNLDAYGDVGRVTLYATEGDLALRTSRSLHCQRLLGRRVGLNVDPLARAGFGACARAGEVFRDGRGERFAVARPHFETVMIENTGASIFGISLSGTRHALHTEGTALYDLFWNMRRNVSAACRAERFLSRQVVGRATTWLLALPASEIEGMRRSSAGTLNPSQRCRLQRDTLWPRVVEDRFWATPDNPQPWPGAVSLSFVVHTPTPSSRASASSDGISAVATALQAALRRECFEPSVDTLSGRAQRAAVTIRGPSRSGNFKDSNGLEVVAELTPAPSGIRVLLAGRESTPELYEAAEEVSLSRVAFVLRRMQRGTLDAALDRLDADVSVCRGNSR